MTKMFYFDNIVLERYVNYDFSSEEHKKTEDVNLAIPLSQFVPEKVGQVIGTRMFHSFVYDMTNNRKQTIYFKI